MKITGHRIETSFYSIDAKLLLHVPIFMYTWVDKTFVYKTTFALDVSTRLQTTTISIKDSARFYSVIPPPTISTSTPAGNIPTSVMYNCGLVFSLGHSAHVEFLPQINILNPPPPILHKIWPYWSIIGKDVLDRYHVIKSPDGSSVTLEK